MASSSAASSSALRSVMRPRLVTQGVTRSSSRVQAEVHASRSFAAAAQRESVEPLEHISPSYSHSPPPCRAPVPPPTTAASAQSYLSDLLHLPPSRAFSLDLALQILTHKSYRYAHLIRHNHPRSRDRYEREPRRDFGVQVAQGEETEGPSSVSHNARLSFLGRRALNTYLALFLHSHLRTDRGLREVDFLRGKGLDEKMKAMTHVNNLGRDVGGQWGVGDVMRWDRNEAGIPNAGLKIRGLTVESILGGVFSEFGSAAAHRAFHLHLLPHLSEQLRDPVLLERAEVMRAQVEREAGGGVVGDIS